MKNTLIIVLCLFITVATMSQTKRFKGKVLEVDINYIKVKKYYPNEKVIPRVGVDVIVYKFSEGVFNNTTKLLAEGTVVESSDKELKIKIKKYKNPFVKEVVKPSILSRLDKVFLDYELLEEYAILDAKDASIKQEQKRRKDLMWQVGKLIDRKNYTEAISITEKEIEKDENFNDCYYYLGTANKHLLKNEKALEQITRFLKNDTKGYQIAYIAILTKARLHRDLDDNKSALKEYDKMIKREGIYLESTALKEAISIKYKLKELDDIYCKYLSQLEKNFGLLNSNKKKYHQYCLNNVVAEIKEYHFDGKVIDQSLNNKTLRVEMIPLTKRNQIDLEKYKDLEYLNIKSKVLEVGKIIEVNNIEKNFSEKIGVAKIIEIKTNAVIIEFLYWEEYQKSLRDTELSFIW